MRNRLFTLFFLICVLSLSAHAVNLGVSVSNFVFTPGITTIAPGDTITWTRVSGTHNVHNTSTPTRFHNTIGGTWTTYVWPCTVSVNVLPYLCQVHGAAMSGTVNVAGISVSSPNGGEDWNLGSFQMITWANSNLPGTANVAIEINRSFPVGSWESIIASTPNDGNHPWSVTGPTGTACRIRIRAVQTSSVSGSISDVSDANFTISNPPPVITLLSPNGGEDWPVGSTQIISWTTQNFGGASVVIELNRSYPLGTWEIVSAGAPDVGFQDVTVTAPPSTTCRMRVSMLGNPAVVDEGDADFAISSAGSILVAEPNGGETYFVGGNLHVDWTASGVTSFDIELNRDYPAGAWEPLGQFAAAPVDIITVGPSSTNCRIRILDSFNSTVADESDADFTLANPLAPSDLVLYPTTTNARLSWHPVFGAGGYNVYRAPLATGPFTDLAGSTPDTFFVDPGIVAANSRYFYQVRVLYP